MNPLPDLIMYVMVSDHDPDLWLNMRNQVTDLMDVFSGCIPEDYHIEVWRYSRGHKTGDRFESRKRYEP